MTTFSLKRCAAVLALTNGALAAAIPFVHLDTAIRCFYNTNTLYAPALLAAVAAWNYRAGKARWTAPLLAALLLVSIRVYATHIEPRNLQVREVTLHSPKVTRPLRILHISDIQSGTIGEYESAVFDRIRDLKPDLVLHTGDLLQPVGGRTWAGEGRKLARLFAGIEPPLGKYTVAGESDYMLAHLSGAQLGGLQFLNNETAIINIDGARLEVLGLTMAQTRSRHTAPVEEMRAWVESAASHTFTIALGHRPDYVLALRDVPVDLCLAGHTHGGQVRLPGFGALVTCSTVPRDWAQGFRTVGATRLNVSAGIGTTRHRNLPPIRINCPPEMTLIHLLPAVETTPA